MWAGSSHVRGIITYVVFRPDFEPNATYFFHALAAFAKWTCELLL